MGVINVTQIERNGKAIASEKMLVEVAVIGAPLLQNSGSKTIIPVQENIVKSRTEEVPVPVQYIVDEDLATVVGLSNEIFSATIVSREGREPVVGATTLGFIVGRVVGAVRADSAGSKFYYYEDGAVSPVEYVVSETPDVIQASL